MQTASPGSYADAGVDKSKIEPFKQAMLGVAERTQDFSEVRHVSVTPEEHGASYWYRGDERRVIFAKTVEGLGNKNWIAQWMYQHASLERRTYFEGIGIDTVLMAANDVVSMGALPFLYMDEVAAGDSDWFQDARRAKAFAESIFQACQQNHMTLGGGESPSLRYLVKAELPVKSAPVLSGCATGIIAPWTRKIDSRKLGVGDLIFGALSSGIHANGISLVIKCGMALEKKFLTPVPGGISNTQTLGDEALIPTLSYVPLVEALLNADVSIRSLLPGTGGGVGKVAFCKRPYTYRIHSWVKVPPLMQFMADMGVAVKECYETFNMGIGYYIFLPPNPDNIAKALTAAKSAGFELIELGRVEEGERKVIFEPENNLVLEPPGE